MSRENRRKVLGAALGLLWLLAGSGTAAAWDSPLDRWHFQSAEIGRFWQEAWSGVQAIWSKTNFGGEPDSGQTSTTAPGPANPSDPENHAEHSVGIDPNG